MKSFLLLFLQAFSTEKILKGHVKICFKISGNKMIEMLKKSEYVRFKKNERKIKSPFMILSRF